MKTYTAPGLREFRLRLPANGSEVTVDFTGGRNCAYASRPSVFSTSDPVLIYLIEHSPEFASGKVRAYDYD